MINIIDLFAGAGGLSEGFHTSPYNTLCHIEMDGFACETLKTREAFYYLQQNNKLNYYKKYLKGSITKESLYTKLPSDLLNKVINEKISEESLDELFNKVDNLVGEESVHGIVGGPPCQAFSMIGRASNKFKKAEDERIYLYEYYVEFLKKYKPMFFVFENVKGLLSFKDEHNELLFPKIVHAFDEIGYEVSKKLINSSEFGVSQERERVFIFGYRKDSTPINFFELLEAHKENSIPVKQLLNDLPVMTPGDEKYSYKRTRPNNLVSKYYRKFDLPLTHSVTRVHNDRDLEIYKLVAEQKQQGIQLRYNELPERLRTHNDTTNFLDRFKALKADENSHTVVAHIAKDGHYYIHYDIEQNRSISVREAARIQGFPDDYYFEGNRGAAFKQIGNAVPPILSVKIANAISDGLKSIEK